MARRSRLIRRGARATTAWLALRSGVKQRATLDARDLSAACPRSVTRARSRPSDPTRDVAGKADRHSPIRRLTPATAVARMPRMPRQVGRHRLAVTCSLLPVAMALVVGVWIAGAHAQQAPAAATGAGSPRA